MVCWSSWSGDPFWNRWLRKCRRSLFSLPPAGESKHQQQGWRLLFRAAWKFLENRKKQFSLATLSHQNNGCEVFLCREKGKSIVKMKWQGERGGRQWHRQHRQLSYCLGGQHPILKCQFLVAIVLLIQLSTNVNGKQQWWFKCLSSRHLRGRQDGVPGSWLCCAFLQLLWAFWDKKKISFSIFVSATQESKHMNLFFFS